MALQAEPSNKDVRALRTRYKKEAAAANAKDRAMYQRAFQKLAKMPDSDPKMPDTDPMPDKDPKLEPQSHPIDSAPLSQTHAAHKWCCCILFGTAFCRSTIHNLALQTFRRMKINHLERLVESLKPYLNTGGR